jgi:hypothetical protein
MNKSLTAGRRTIPVAMMIAAPIILALAGLVGAGDNSALCASQAPVADHVGRFPDFGQLPPPEVFQPERTFKLSQDYPAFQPLVEKPVQDILAIDYTKDWKAYADAAFNYILEGNIHGEGGRPKLPPLWQTAGSARATPTAFRSARSKRSMTPA